MVNRKTVKPLHNSTQSLRKHVQFDASRSFRDLRREVTKLKKDFEEQKVELGRLRQLVYKSQWSELEPPPIDVDKLDAGKKRPGPKPKHPWGVTHLRNNLVAMLECFWPELEPFCSPHVQAEKLKFVLKAITNTIRGDAAKHLLANFDTLTTFLGSNRFRNDPRQIANALAGAPLKWWTSLRMCQAEPCDFPIGHRAIKAYIRRKHKRLFALLEREMSVVNFGAVKKSYRTQDKKIYGYSGKMLYEEWVASKSDYSKLGLSEVD